MDAGEERGKFGFDAASALARVRLERDVPGMPLCDEGAQNETFAHTYTHRCSP